VLKLSTLDENRGLRPASG